MKIPKIAPKKNGQIDVECPVCGTIFYRWPTEVRRGKARNCSLACKTEASRVLLEGIENARSYYLNGEWCRRWRDPETGRRMKLDEEAWLLAMQNQRGAKAAT